MEPGNGKVRSIDVAALAGTSRSTVSRVLSGDPRISDATREWVLAAAEQLGYQPNLIARGLKNQNTGIVGVVVTNLENPYHARVLQLMIGRLGEARMAPLVFVCSTTEGAESAIRRMTGYQVDAVIGLAAPFTEQIVQSCKAARKPLVVMNSYDGDADVSVITGDSAKAGAMVADHLLECGARSFAFFGGEDNTSISRDRGQGFSERLAALGQPAPRFWSSRYDYAAARNVGAQIIADRPAAVFCANDTLAIALCDVLRETGGGYHPLIVGYDNSALAARPPYDLTSVDENLDESISLSIAAALAAIDAPDSPAQRHTVTPFLVRRGSTLRALAS